MIPIKNMLRTIFFIITSVFLLVVIITNDIFIIIKKEKIIDNVSYRDDAIDIKNPTTYDITVLVKFDYTNYEKYDKNVTIDKLKNYRSKVKKYYYEKNELLVKQIGLDIYNYSSSYFSPYIELVFDNITEYKHNKEKLKLLLNDSMVDTASINYMNLDEASVNNSPTSLNYLFDDALLDIGINSSQFTGNGIKIGTIESATPDSSINLKPNLFTTIPENNPTTSEHSTNVTSIIGGRTGIAKNAHLYCVGLEDFNFITCTNKLIDEYGVHVINISRTLNNNDRYDNFCAYVDYVARESHCTIVKSAGNNGNTSFPTITSPGYGLNIITVGSTSKNKKVSNHSSYYTDDGFSYKPDVVAPGENIVGIQNISNPLTGTSYAAPMVTGIVALLMEEFSELVGNPVLVKSVIQNCCNLLPSQYNQFETECGFGLVNYQNARNYLANSQYFNFTIPINAQNGFNVASYNITIPAYSHMSLNANWFFCSEFIDLETINGSDFYTPYFTNCDIKLYDLQNNTYVCVGAHNSTTEFITYRNPTSSSRTYRIDVIVNSNNELNKEKAGSITYNFNHSHRYDYVALNNTYHNRICYCGDVSKKRHVLSTSYSGVPGNSRYVPCVDCGYMVDTWGGGMFPIQNDDDIMYFILG